MHPISRILYILITQNTTTIYLTSLLPKKSLRHFHFTMDTTLHSRIDLAVSLQLNGFVSVRTTMLTHDGGYPLRFCKITLTMNVRTFLTPPYSGCAVVQMHMTIYSILYCLYQVLILIFVQMPFLLHTLLGIRGSK